MRSELGAFNCIESQILDMSWCPNLLHESKWVKLGSAEDPWSNQHFQLFFFLPI